MLIGDNVVRGRYGLTCRQHNSIKDELINTMCWGWKTECHRQSIETQSRWKTKIAVNAKHLLGQICPSAFQLTRWNQKTLHPCIQQWTCWQSPHLLQIPSQASVAPVWRWLEGLYEISSRAPFFTTNLYSFRSADLYIQLSAHGKSSMTWECILPFWKKGLISLSFRKKPQFYSDQRVSYDAAAGAINWIK